MDEVMTVQEAIQRLKISRTLGYQLAREGKLPGCIRLGAKRYIVSRKRFEEWLNSDSASTQEQRA